MDEAAFDRALVASAFDMAAREGWARVSVAEAARRAGLPLDRVRARFPVRAAVLARFGLQADQVALAGGTSGLTVRDRLFELLMRRFDTLQGHRDGVIAVMQAAPARPLMAAFLGAATLRSMGWMLEAAGESARGPLGRLRAKALTGVWVYTLRVWQSDHSADLSATMAALDRALGWAEQAAGWVGGRGRPTGEPESGTSAADPGTMPPAESPPHPETPGSGASEADPGTLPPGQPPSAA